MTPLTKAEREAVLRLATGVAKPRAKPRDLEHVEQCLFFQRVALRRETRDLPITATANGGQRHKAVAAKLKAAGVKAGVPDILCFAPGALPRMDGRPVVGLGARPVGLAIEMKIKPNGPTPAQLAWLALLRAAGWRTEVCYSHDAAWAALCDHLGLAP